MNTNFAHKLKLIRSKYKLTQEEFANILDISRSHLAKLESSILPPNDKFITYISTKLKISKEWLLDETNNNTNMFETDEFIKSSLLTKYNLLEDVYQEFILNQIDQLLALQLKVSNKKESQK